MIGQVFLDTNVALYVIDARDSPKQERARIWLRHLIEGRNLIVSPQVLNELYWIGRQRFPQVPADDLRRFVSDFIPRCTAPLDATVTQEAFVIEQRYRLSWWDCLIVASALAARCRVLLTEDMQHGLKIDTLTILSPFLATPAQAVTEL
jgi:predicted nucleic acid-binding protein